MSTDIRMIDVSDCQSNDKTDLEVITNTGNLQLDQYIYRQVPLDNNYWRSFGRDHLHIV